MSESRIVRAESEQKRPGLQELGYIRIGKKNEQGYPTSLDYFIITGREGKPSVYENLFTKALGAQPKLIPIVFFTNDDSINCVEEWQAYTASSTRPIGKGDGRRFEVWDANAPHPTEKDKKGNFIVVEDREENGQAIRAWDHPAMKAIPIDNWKVRLTLRFIIPSIPSVIGCYVFKTGGDKTTIPAIVSSYDEIKRLRGGQIAGFQFALTVGAQKSVTPGEKPHHYKVVSLVPFKTETTTKKLNEYHENLIEESIFAKTVAHTLEAAPVTQQLTEGVKDAVSEEVVETPTQESDYTGIDETVQEVIEAPADEEPKSVMKPNERVDELSPEQIAAQANAAPKTVTPSIKKVKQGGMFGEGK